MKVLLAGAYGKLGSEILKELIKQGHQVVAADMAQRDVDGLNNSSVDFKKIDATKPETMKGICDGCDVVITTMGLTGASATITNYDIDFRGNLNLLNEALAAQVQYFSYVSVIRADEATEKVPMVHAKALFETELKKSGIKYCITRPTGYFYDIVKVFRPMIEKGEVTLLGKKPVSANVIDTPDFAEFIVNHMTDDKAVYSIGGTETYTYEEIARMCFTAAGKPAVIKRAPAWLFDVLASLPKNKKNGKSAIIHFSKWTLTRDMVGDTKYGKGSFSQYIKESFK